MSSAQSWSGYDGTFGEVPAYGTTFKSHCGPASEPQISLSPPSASASDAVEWRELKMEDREPLIMAGESYSSMTATEFGYTFPSSQQLTAGKLAEMPMYPPQAMRALQHTRHFVVGSDQGTEGSSTSPDTLFSEPSDRGAWSTEPVADRASPCTTWTGSETGPYTPMKRSSSYGSIPYTDSSSSSFHSGLSVSDFTGLPCSGLGIAVPGFQQLFEQPFNHNQPQSCEPAWSGENWHSTRWSNVGQGHEGGFGLPSDGQPYVPVQYPVYQQTCSNPANRSEDSNVYGQQLHEVPRSEPMLFSSYGGEDNGGEQQGTNGAHVSALANAQRKQEDQILLEGKAAGKTYKEIRRNMNTSVAESTLRGRYRSLTKARKDRVRKPVWTFR